MRPRTAISALLLLGTACAADRDLTPTTTLPPGSLGPPATVQTLTASWPGEGTVRLRWRAPAGHGRTGRAARYDIRRLGRALTEEDWEAATRLDSIPTPRNLGEQETLAVRHLPNGRWFFALKSADEQGQWSDLSNVAAAEVADHTPPGPVTDLTADSATVSSLRLRWTAPGNDGAVGTAARYDLRYATAAITGQNWSGASTVPDLPPPAPGGRAQSSVLAGLQPATTYYFALRSVDDAGNLSALSNLASDSTLDLVRLTVSARMLGAASPAWSPDGGSILFLADWDRPGVRQLYRMAASGGAPVRLASDSLGISAACWSPDGSRIAFAPRSRGGIWLQAAQASAPPTPLVPADSLVVSAIAWSSSGTLAYSATSILQVPFTEEIYTVPAGGGAPEVAVTGAGPNSEPAWSPDGTKLALARWGTENVVDVWVRYWRSAPR